jgi:polysaccharide biosynthesis/export protein
MRKQLIYLMPSAWQTELLIMPTSQMLIVVRKSNGTSHTYKVDATSRNIYSSEVFYLLPNDFVYIPPTNLKRTRDNTNVYSLILSAVSTLIVVGTALNNNFF